VTIRVGIAVSGDADPNSRLDRQESMKETTMSAIHDPDEHSDPLPTAGHAAEFGLASLIMSAVLFLASPMTLILAVQVWRFAHQARGVVHLHAWLARIGVSVALVTAIAAVVFGIRGLRSAIRGRQPRGLCVAGLFMSVAALILWAITAIGVLNATESLLLMHGG
jgi:hypothetical protein